MEFVQMEISNLDLIKDSLYTDFDDFWSYQTLKDELMSSTSKYFICKNQDLILRFLWHKSNF